MRDKEAPKHVHKIIAEQRLILVRFRGYVTLTDLKRELESLWADPAYDGSFNGIVNLEGVTTRVRVDELNGLIKFLEKRRPSTGHWIAVFNDPRLATLGVLFKAAWRGSFTLDVVSSWEAACHFLRVKHPAFSPVV